MCNNAVDSGLNGCGVEKFRLQYVNVRLWAANLEVGGNPFNAVDVATDQGQISCFAMGP
jgi:hypothetical protein